MPRFLFYEFAKFTFGTYYDAKSQHKYATYHGILNLLW